MTNSNMDRKNVIQGIREKLIEHKGEEIYA